MHDNFKISNGAWLHGHSAPKSSNTKLEKNESGATPVIPSTPTMRRMKASAPNKVLVAPPAVVSIGSDMIVLPRASHPLVE
jgi:hypothetical protein